MTDLTFEAALNDRTTEMLDACTRCGKCVEVCPSAQAANIKDAAPEAVITGILDIVRTGDGPEMSRRWAASCTLSGACIEACNDGVNPRFLLAMARVAIRQRESEPAGRRRDGDVLRTPHIALLALDIMDALGVSYQAMGGPSHCCGVMQLRAGDVEMSGRMGTNSIEKMSHSKSGQVLSWCPSCYVQFSETTLPALERQRGSRPFEMGPAQRRQRRR